jgi:hypothetical protein
LTSIVRTAGCGPACPVVWEGFNWISVDPYPDCALALLALTHIKRLPSVDMVASH